MMTPESPDSRWRLCLAIAALASFSLVATRIASGQEKSAVANAAIEDTVFQEQVQPLLMTFCVRCHNPDNLESGNLDATNEGEPAEYYRNMFDLIALAFDADITWSVAFMLNREDGMGISDSFPLKLGLTRTHHNLSHAEDKDGQLEFAKYDLFLSEQIVHFLKRLEDYKDNSGSARDNTIVLFGSGCSTTHYPKNLPTLIAGGTNMGLKHGTHWCGKDARMSNVFLSILRSMQIEEPAFGDSTGTASESIFG
jgi:hypothetical protein